MPSLVSDFQSFLGEGNSKDKLRIIFFSSGFFCITLYRIQDLFFQRKLIVFSYIIHRLNLLMTGADILPGAQIGPGVRIEHPVGIVIGAGVKTGSNLTILQGVTIGASSKKGIENTSKFPIIGDNVYIGANSSIIGGIEIGSDTHVGAHTLVIRSADKGSTLFGVPAHKFER